MFELYVVVAGSLFGGWLCFFMMFIGDRDEWSREHFAMFGGLLVLILAWPVSPVLIAWFNTWLKKTGRW